MYKFSLCKNNSKYHNRKTILDGIEFDSVKEAERYSILKLLLKCGEICDLKLQPKFILQEAFNKNGKHFKAITYSADFQYFDKKKNMTIVEDVKGVGTDVFKLKLKLFEYKFPDLELTLIK